MAWYDFINPLKLILECVRSTGEMIASTAQWVDGRWKQEDAKLEKLIEALMKSDAELEHACRRLIGYWVPSNYIRDVMATGPDKIERLRAYGWARTFIRMEKRTVRWKGIMKTDWVRGVHLAVPTVIFILSMVFLIAGAAIDGVIPKTRSPLHDFGLFFTWATMWFIIMLQMALVLRNQVTARRLVGTRVR